MADAKTERCSPDLSTDLDLLRRQWCEEGAESERARIQAVQEQSLPGHEALIQTLMFDGKTTGPGAAVQILAAEKEQRSRIAANLKVGDGRRPQPGPGAWDIAAQFTFCVVKPGE
jgi:hypothetical protein